MNTLNQAKAMSSEFAGLSAYVANVPDAKYVEVQNLPSTHGVEGVHTPKATLFTLVNGAATAINDTVIDVITGRRGAIDETVVAVMSTRLGSVRAEVARLDNGLIYLREFAVRDVANAAKLKTEGASNAANATIRPPASTSEIIAESARNVPEAARNLWDGFTKTAKSIIESVGFPVIAVLALVAVIVVFRK